VIILPRFLVRVVWVIVKGLNPSCSPCPPNTACNARGAQMAVVHRDNVGLEFLPKIQPRHVLT